MRNVQLKLLTIVAATLTAPIGTSAQGENPGHPSRYTLVEIAFPQDPSCEEGFWVGTYVRRMNERGDVVGYTQCFVASGDPEGPYVSGPMRAFRWNPATGASVLPPADASSSGTLGRDINEEGTAVGWENHPNGHNAPLLWPTGGGVSYAFGTVACEAGGYAYQRTRADGINDKGSIGGSALQLINGYCAPHLFIKLTSGEEIIGPLGSSSDINNHDVMIGRGGPGVVLWSFSEGTTTVLAIHNAPYDYPSAWSLNDSNEVVGHMQHGRDVNGVLCHVGDSALYWDAAGSQTTLPGLPGTESNVAFGINGYSEIVGFSAEHAPCGSYDSEHSRAVYWYEGGVTDLNSLLDPVTAAQIRLTRAAAINDRGQIIAHGVRLDESKVPCPEWNYDAQGQPYYDDARTCYTERAYVLTPAW